MEALFSSHNNTTRKGLDVFYRVSSQRSMNIIAVIGLVVFGGSFVWFFVLQTFEPLTVTLTGMGFVFCILLLFFYKLLALLAYNNALKLHNGYIPPTDIVFDEKLIRMNEGKFSVRIPYGDIIAVYHKRGIFALMTGKSNGLLIPESTIKGGTAAEFEALLLDHCTEAKIH